MSDCCHQGFTIIRDPESGTITTGDFCSCPIGQLHKAIYLGDFDNYPELCKFALLMVAKLKDNEDRGGWKNSNPTVLRAAAKYHMAYTDPGSKDIDKSAVNCANYLMMYLDVMEKL